MALASKVCIKLIFFFDSYRLQLLKVMNIQTLIICNVTTKNADSFISALKVVHKYNQISNLELNMFNITEEIFWEFINLFPNLKILNIRNPMYHINCTKLLYSLVNKLNSFTLESMRINDKDENVNYIMPNNVTLKELHLSSRTTISFYRSPEIENLFNALRGSLESLTIYLDEFYKHEMEWLIKMNFNYLKHITIHIQNSLDSTLMKDFIHMIAGQNMTNYKEESDKSISNMMYSNLQSILIKTVKTKNFNVGLGTLNFSRLQHLSVSIFYNICFISNI